MKIYIDVTNLIQVNFLTGIQRVVREVVIRMIKHKRVNLVLLNYIDKTNCYQIVDREGFYQYFANEQGDKKDILLPKYIDIEEITAGDIFFDIDGVWNSPLRRSYLLPKLKQQGAKLVVYIYDIIPITHPQFCHRQTVFNFMNYLGAYLQHADLIITSAQSTLDALDELYKKLELQPIPGYVSWLGSDFQAKDDDAAEINEEAKKAVAAGDYVLMVGTIEPRKNHAMVLDAFEAQLFAQGVNLIFAGRTGWNVEKLTHRIEKHEKKGKQLFHLKGMNDETIDYLYQHAKCVAFPTFNEGFGLPIIEAFQRGTPVLASDIPVLREVGGEYSCYFQLNDANSFIETYRREIMDQERYQEIKQKLHNYQSVTWEEVAVRIEESLLTLEQHKLKLPEKVKQMVYLTARYKDLKRSLPYVEQFMPFIEELVICCPDAMVQEMKEDYKGRCKVTYLTDSEILQGRALPKDHALRNFFLRCLIMESGKLDDVVIMSDDDYRPLCPIGVDTFMEQGKYIGYYCYDYKLWKGDQMNYSSFDISMEKTKNFLLEEGMPSRMYDSHMPQIIDTRVFCEMLKVYPHIKELGYSEWSTYFNYLSKQYPDQMEARRYVTMAWPGAFSDWDLQFYPKQYLFENFYESLYEENNIFAAYATERSAEYLADHAHEIITENMEKVAVYMNYHTEHIKTRMAYQVYEDLYAFQYGERPRFVIELLEQEIKIKLPEYIALRDRGVMRIPFVIEGELEAPLMIKYRQVNHVGDELVQGNPMEFNTDKKLLSVPITAAYGGFRGIMELTAEYKGIERMARTKICVVKKNITT